MELGPSYTQITKTAIVSIIAPPQIMPVDDAIMPEHGMMATPLPAVKDSLAFRLTFIPARGQPPPKKNLQK